MNEIVIEGTMDSHHRIIDESGIHGLDVSYEGFKVYGLKVKDISNHKIYFFRIMTDIDFKDSGRVRVTGQLIQYMNDVYIETYDIKNL